MKVIIAIILSLMVAGSAQAAPAPDAATYPYSPAQMQKAMRSFIRWVHNGGDNGHASRITARCRKTSPVTYRCLTRYYVDIPTFETMYGRADFRDCVYNPTIRRNKFYGGFNGDHVAVKVGRKPGGVICKGIVLTSGEV